jgi:hypothetical protein
MADGPENKAANLLGDTTETMSVIWQESQVNVNVLNMKWRSRIEFRAYFL